MPSPAKSLSTFSRRKFRLVRMLFTILALSLTLVSLRNHFHLPNGRRGVHTVLGSSGAALGCSRNSRAQVGSIHSRRISRFSPSRITRRGRKIWASIEQFGHKEAAETEEGGNSRTKSTSHYSAKLNDIPHHHHSHHHANNHHHPEPDATNHHGHHQISYPDHHSPRQLAHTHSSVDKSSHLHIEQREATADDVLPTTNEIGKVPAPGSSTPPNNLLSSTSEWQALQHHAKVVLVSAPFIILLGSIVIDEIFLHIIQSGFPHLRDLLQDQERVEGLTLENDGFIIDFSRQKMTMETKRLLLDLAEKANLKEKIFAMVSGAPVNPTEHRAALHMALRASKDDTFNIMEEAGDAKQSSLSSRGDDDENGVVNVVPLVHEVLDRIEDFSSRVRDGSWAGASGRPLRNILVVGIGGSYLGTNFVDKALLNDPQAKRRAAAARNATLRFLSNVDPVNVATTVEGMDPEESLVVVISKTFTTAETMLNAKTLKDWLVKGQKNTKEGGEEGGPAAELEFERTVVKRHMVAVSADVEKASEFGVDPDNVFTFWDWVGGRYSVSSAVGILPLALHYGMETVRDFLAGARAMDRHFIEAPLSANLAAMMGLINIWQTNFQGFSTRAIIPYSHALSKFAPHVQQVGMESNGKSVTLGGEVIDYASAEIEFGEPGTNAQHSFFQMLHQGRVVPVDFLGFTHSQNPLHLEGEPVANHDELMANFFAQPDALAIGQTARQLREAGVAEELVPHKMMPGDRPSTVILIDRPLDAHTIGQLLALYEHRIAVQGFMWSVNSFDQYGVELGKSLGLTVREQLIRSRTQNAPVNGFNPSTTNLLNRYLQSTAKDNNTTTAPTT